MNCYVDIETTGFSPKNDAFTRLTAIRAHGYEIVDIYDQMVNPGRVARPAILQMTGLRQEVLDLMPTLNEVREDFRKFIKGAQLIAWSSYENRWLPHHGLAAKCFDAIVEVKRVTNKTLPVADYKLPTICKHFHIPLRHHDSLSDTLAVYHICNLTGAYR